MSFFVYILVSLVDGSLYTGQTSNLQKRLERHNKGYGKSTKAKAPFRLGYFETYLTRSEAMWREWDLKKNFSTEQKKELIMKFDKSKIIQYSEV
ncbi:MAG: GIY-YIG nuclease family protein [Ignavibacteriae bacterium]|nr:GIY-YIG nuclease family protein [Ignavibacteriota bacterium]